MSVSTSAAKLIAAGQPRYMALARELASLISSGTVAPGDRLPGERDLCRRFGTSRDTVRRALAQLREEGLIEADPQRGWFVSSTSVGEPNALLSFSEMARARGLAATSRVVRQEVRRADLDEAEALGVAPGVELFEVERIRMLEDVPVSVERSRIPLAVAPGLTETDLSASSLYETLRAEGAAPARANYTLQAVAADASLAPVLDLEVGAPLLKATATTYDDAGRRIELSDAAFRGDRYRFHTTLYRTGP